MMSLLLLFSTSPDDVVDLLWIREFVVIDFQYLYIDMLNYDHGVAVTHTLT